MSTITLPETAGVTVLVDPELLGPLHEAAGHVEIAVLCGDRRVLMQAAGPGFICVLADPTPATVDRLVGSGADVVAVQTIPGTGEEWLREVVEAGAVAAPSFPGPERLSKLLSALVRAAGASTAR